MRKLLLLAAANVRAAKGRMFILALLFFTAALMLNMGFNILIGFGGFFDQMAEELNTSEMSFGMSKELYTDEVEQYFVQNSSEFELSSVISPVVNFDREGELQERRLFFRDRAEQTTLSQWTLLGDYLPAADDSIYLPFAFSAVDGFNLGDEIVFSIDDRDFSFVVAGFSESIYGDRMFSVESVYISSAKFERLSYELEHYLGYVIAVNGIDNVIEADYELLNILIGGGLIDFATMFFTTANLEQTAESRTGTALFMGGIMVVFTIVIAAVSLFVIRFRIKDSIEDDMPKIGSLQAIGYTSGQISGSIVAQYGILALAASLLSVLPAYLLLPTVTNVLAMQSGLYWQPEFIPFLNTVIELVLAGVVVLTAWATARKVRKINPVVALRGGMSTRNFKRTFVALDRTRLPRTLALASKSVLQGARQSFMVFSILVSVSFVAAISIILYYNAAVDISTFEQVPGIERSNAVLGLAPEQDADDFAELILAQTGVVDAQYLDHGRITLNDLHVSAIIMDDYSRRVTQNLHSGIFPRHDNEITISVILARDLDLEIGDEVLIGSDNVGFMIVGLSQGMETGDARGVYLKGEGIIRAGIDLSRMSLMVYLEDDVDVDAFISNMEERYPDYVMFGANVDTAFQEGVSGFAGIFAAIGVGILAVSSFVVVLILYFVIGSTVIKQHRDLGVKKAVGYTTANLMSQVSLSFALPVVLGTVIGCALGAALLNPIMSVGMAEMGVTSANYLVNAGWVAGTGVFIVVLAYAVSTLVTLRIRKISAYSLIVE